MPDTENQTVPAALGELKWHDSIDANYIDKVSARGLAGAASVGALVTEVGMQFSDGHPYTMIATGLAAAAVTLRLERRERKISRADEAATYEVQQQVSQFLGRPAELYSWRPRHLVDKYIDIDGRSNAMAIRVYDAPLKPDGLPKSDREVIEGLKQLSQAAKFSYVIVPKAMLERTNALDELRKTRNAWQTPSGLHKGLVGLSLLEMNQNGDGLYSVRTSPNMFKRWLKCADGYSDDRLREYLDVMKRAAPNKPLVLALGKLDPTDSIQRKHIKIALRRSLGAELESVVIEKPDPLDRTVKRRNYVFGDIREGKDNLVPKVHLRDQHYKPVASHQNLLQVLEEDPERLQSVVDNQYASPKDKLRAASILAYLEAVKANHVQRTYPPRPSGDNKPVAQLQEVVARTEPSLWVNRYLRYAVAGLLVGLCGAQIGNLRQTPLHNSLKDNSALDASEGFLKPVVDRPMRLLDESWGKQPAPAGSEAPKTLDRGSSLPTELTSHIGNVGELSHAPIWNIQSFGGMKATGYWTEDVESILQADMSAWVASPVKHPKQDDPNYIPLHAIDNESSAPHLVLSKEAQVKDDGEGWYAVPVPVLEHTYIAEATITDPSGRVLPTGVQITPSGTTLLLIHSNGDQTPPKLTLSYSLRSSVTAPFPHMSEPVSVQVLNSAGVAEWDTNGYVTRPVRPLQSVWKETTGNDVPTINDDQAQLRNFYYDINPFNGTPKFDDEEGFARTVLSGGRAQCNVADTLIVASHPNDLNYAIGYHNEGSTAMTLSADQAHAWGVDQKGSIIDATPEKIDAKPKPAAPASLDQDLLRDITLGVMALGVGGIAVGSYGGIRQFARRKRLLQKAKRLDRFGFDTVSHGYELLDTLAYAPDDQDHHLTGRKIIGAEDALAIYQERQQKLPAKRALLAKIKAAEAEGRFNEVPATVLKAAKTLAR